MVLEYYALLRSVLGTKPHLRRCLKRCRHCRIFFFTDPRNAGRKDMRDVGRNDLGCLFGCREAHRKQQSSRRREKEEQAQSAEAVPGPWPEPLVEHVRVVVSLIEGRSASREEIREMLAKVLRQQGMGRRSKIDQAVAWLNENPP